MLKLRKVAITGSIASGKSTACSYFKKLGAYVVSSDKLAHELLKDTLIQTKIKKKLELEGRLSRKNLANVVFKDQKKLNSLTSILYPSIMNQLKIHFKQAKKEHSPLCIIETPLLFESKQENIFNTVICMKTKKSLSKTRCKYSDFEKRYRFQMPQAQKEKRAHFLLSNNGTKQSLKKQVQSLFDSLTQNQK
ncbi:MAG: Dephospho-CoA kinase [Chlamydiae bacterium]|nr:Dephospho-CoA kinase [Chlamydiota bacterium]